MSHDQIRRRFATFLRRHRRRVPVAVAPFPELLCDRFEKTFGLTRRRFGLVEVPNVRRTGLVLLLQRRQRRGEHAIRIRTGGRTLALRWNANGNVFEAHLKQNENQIFLSVSYKIQVKTK
jgi:hypothetical protein